MPSQVSITEVSKSLKKLVPKGVFTAVSDDLSCYLTNTEDQKYLSQVSSQKRVSEFKLGRKSARLALADLSAAFSDAELSRLPSGAIDWPDGVCGSISHSGEIAVATVSTRTTYQSVGIDFEINRDFNSALIKKIALRSEFDLARKSLGNDSRAFFLLFCSKEALFKCLSPLGYEGLSFFDAELVKVNTPCPEYYNLGYDFSKLSAKKTIPLKISVFSCSNPDFTAGFCVAQACRE